MLEIVNFINFLSLILFFVIFHLILFVHQLELFFFASSYLKGELKIFYYAIKKTAIVVAISRAPIIKFGDNGKS